MPTENRRLKLIVNADDFGLSDSINSGILEAHRYGIVTSVSLMPTAPATPSAIALSKEMPGLDIGIQET
jgi:hypothetical protein